MSHYNTPARPDSNRIRCLQRARHFGRFGHVSPPVRWCRAWEGDYASGHDEVRAYRRRQRAALNPHGEPTAIRERADGQREGAVHQVGKDKQGQLRFDGPLTHMYTLADGLLQQLDIEQES